MARRRFRAGVVRGLGCADGLAIRGFGGLIMTDPDIITKLGDINSTLNAIAIILYSMVFLVCVVWWWGR